MLEVETELLEKYKRLDSICRDIFSCQYGVSEYINQMEYVSVYRQSQVPSWREDYRTLKRLRWLRNQIVHETYATDCDIDDIELLDDFQVRILTQTDPLALLRKIEQHERNTTPHQQVAVSKNFSSPITAAKTREPNQHTNHNNRRGFSAENHRNHCNYCCNCIFYILYCLIGNAPGRGIPPTLLVHYSDCVQ